MTIAMTVLALLLPCLILAAWTLERRERNQDLRDLRADQAREREAWQAERRELLNRIKPETAQPLPAPSAVRETPKVALDDDQQVWAAMQGMSAEEFAQAMEQTERQMAAATAMAEDAA